MAIPADPVVIDQRNCVFVPRVVGARLGQPMEGMVHEVRLGAEEGMLQIKCDRHRWMTEYVGTVAPPYFAVSDRGGTFTIEGVPAGTHTVQAWHEVYGTLTQTVRVEAGAVTMADFTYPGGTS